MTERFTLIERVGRGGMGVVWRARDTVTGEDVALKLLHENLLEDDGYLERFQREVEVTQRIDSPYVVRTLGFGRHEGRPFIAMELMEGPSLRDRLKQRGAMPWPEAKRILLDAARGLEAVHAAGIIHRDTKPSNIMLTADGRAKLADFGIARALDLTRLTGSATMLGTPMYMSPDGEITPRSDLYSLGCVAYELLTGAPPFVGDSQQQVLLKHLRETPDFSRIRDPGGRRICEWLLQKQPEHRPASAAQLASVLAGGPPGVGGGLQTDPVANQEPAKLQRRTPVFGLLSIGAILTGVAVAAGIGLGSWATRHGGPAPVTDGQVATTSATASGATDVPAPPSLAAETARPTATLAAVTPAPPGTGGAALDSVAPGESCDSIAGQKAPAGQYQPFLNGIQLLNPQIVPIDPPDLPDLRNCRMNPGDKLVLPGRGLLPTIAKVDVETSVPLMAALRSVLRDGASIPPDLVDLLGANARYRLCDVLDHACLARPGTDVLDASLTTLTPPSSERACLRIDRRGEQILLICEPGP